MDLAEKLLTNFVRDPISECWIWKRAKSTAGYGQLRIKRQSVYVHRLAYELWRGPIPARMYVCHGCDQPACLNPDHLWIGTAQENSLDGSRKGRIRIWQSGEDNHQAKLSDAQVRKIRSLAGEKSHSKIAKLFGVCRQHVGEIINYKKRNY
jgi:HNH endonuclease